MPTDSPEAAGPAMAGRRVKLRPLSEADAGALTEAVDVSRELLRRRLKWASAAAAGKEDASRFIERSAREIRSGTALVWGIFEAKSGALAGVASLAFPDSPERARFGCWVRSDRQDKGYATEGGKLVVEHGFRKLGTHRFYARIDPANRAFRKVLKKMGFRYEGCLRDDKKLNGRWVDQECWGLLKPEWKR